MKPQSVNSPTLQVSDHGGPRGFMGDNVAAEVKELQAAHSQLVESLSLATALETVCIDIAKSRAHPGMLEPKQSERKRRHVPAQMHLTELPVPGRRV